MRAKLTIDMHGLIDVELYPDGEAEKLILMRLAETKQLEVTKKMTEIRYFQDKPELISVVIGEVPQTKAELKQSND